MFDLILSNACPSEEISETVAVYYIETHCVGFWVTAERVQNGTWDHEMQDWAVPPRYKVLDYRSEIV